jgi:excisionase family DNA binding protein
MDTEKYYSPKEIADRLGCSVVTVRKWYREGRLQAVKAGHNVRITESALQAFLQTWTAGESPKVNQSSTEPGTE